MLATLTTLTTLTKLTTPTMSMVARSLGAASEVNESKSYKKLHLRTKFDLFLDVIIWAAQRFAARVINEAATDAWKLISGCFTGMMTMPQDENKEDGDGDSEDAASAEDAEEDE